MLENTLLNSEEKSVLFSYYSTWSEKVINYHQCGCQFNILNELEWTSLLGNQVYFEELDVGLKKIHKGGESYKGIACKKRQKMRLNLA